MGRLVAVVVAAVVLVTPAAAELSGSVLAVSASGQELVVLSANGEVTARLLGGRQFVVVDASWSPDGRRIAFTSPRANGEGREVYVIDADGAGLHAVTDDSNADRFNTLPLWISPSEIVYHRREDRPTPHTDVRVVDVETRAVRVLAQEADWNFPLRLQPHGSLLMYTLPMNLRRVTVDLRTGERRPLPEEISEPVAWSPDGALLAYGTSSGLHVVRPDGTGRRTLVANRLVREVEWAPDGRRILFTDGEILGPIGGKGGTPILFEIYSVGVDGGGLRRLTGIQGDGPLQIGLGAMSPSPWPGGSRVFFRAHRVTSDPHQHWVMNADGTCESPWGPRVPAVSQPQWRPMAADGAASIDCSSAILRVRTDTSEIGLRQRLLLTATVRNDGTRPLRNLRLNLGSVPGSVHPPSGCDELSCPLGTLAPNTSAVLTFAVSARRPGRLRIGTFVDYEGGPDVFPADNRVTTLADVLPCDLVGSWRADRIDGTARRDRICAGPGDDRIDAGAGNDVIDAGGGRDTVLAGRGRDTIRGGGGSDVILVRDRVRDIVDCGTEADTVIADRRDVTRGCERVLRG